MKALGSLCSLLLVREGRAFVGIGDTSCRCTGSNAGMPADADMGAEYATYCAAWDEPQEICVDKLANSLKLDWCSKEWCYVEEHCPSARPSAYFPGSGLFYSYSPCAEDDTFSSLCNHRERHSVSRGNLAGLIAVTGDLPSAGICGGIAPHRRLHGTAADSGNENPEETSLSWADQNGDGVVTEEDRKMYFDGADADGDGCLGLCEYMDWHSHQQGCPLTKYWKLNYASWFTAETDPMIGREQVWKEGFCITEEEFMKGFEGRYWRCHRKREQYFNPTHITFPPFCTDPVPAKKSI
jgi:hypothetical protein